MSNLTSPQPPQHFLELIRRLYDKRDLILESSNRLVEYSYELQNCRDNELESLQSKITQEMNKIVSNVSELAPLLANPHIVGSISDITRILNMDLENLKFHKDTKYIAALHIRNYISPLAVMTRLKLTPKSIKQAFGVEIGVKDIVQLKGFFEHHQDNY